MVFIVLSVKQHPYQHSLFFIKETAEKPSMKCTACDKKKKRAKEIDQGI